MGTEREGALPESGLGGKLKVDIVPRVPRYELHPSVNVLFLIVKFVIFERTAVCE